MVEISKDKGYQAFRLLQFTFVVALVIAGLDKFFNFLAYWPSYLAPPAHQATGGHGETFMMIAGVIEIIVGLGMIFKPKIFAYIVAFWLLGIIINLLLTGQYFDIALRDLGLLLSAVALGLLSQKYEHVKERSTKERRV